MSKKNFAEVVIGVPIEGPFHYSIPDDILNKIEVGMRVWVPFKNRKAVGYVVGFVDSPKVAIVKDIEEVIDEEPIISSAMLTLTRWAADYYCASWGEVLEAAIPGGLKKGKAKIRTLLEKESVREGPCGAESLTKLQEGCQINFGQDRFSLNPEQEEALSRIVKAVDKGLFKPFLLHGITGSGKTEIYLRAIRHTLTLGRTSIILVPEISLTPQITEIFKERFGDIVAIFHSSLSDGERFIQWKRILKGHARIVVGARSGIFAPVSNLGLVVVDEEHENTYKQEDSPKYNARDIAVIRAKFSNSVVILGSATPSLESYYNAVKGKYELIRLTERVDGKLLPKVNIVDMREEIMERRFNAILSRRLSREITDALNEKRQVILFLNRRGFSTFVHCKRCGLVLKCKHCSVTLTYHSDIRKAICHYCNFSIDPPQVCPACNNNYMRYFGIGTEKVESEIARLFPCARVARMDTDTTTRKGAHKKILDDFKNRKTDILVGTQMIAKGLDFPNVALVGVISADTALNFPHFRSCERTFSLLTQVAGRAGRGEGTGKVIIQTYAPMQYAIVSASRHDYMEFYRQEIVFRKELKFPPFTHLVNIVLRAKREDRVIKAASSLADSLRTQGAKKGIEVVGPAPLPVQKVRGEFRWSILLKGANTSELHTILKNMPNRYNRIEGVALSIDIDPK